MHGVRRHPQITEPSSTKKSKRLDASHGPEERHQAVALKEAEEPSGDKHSAERQVRKARHAPNAEGKLAGLEEGLRPPGPRPSSREETRRPAYTC